ncbi:unnamed protein product [Linum trigynum]|uniref:Uncharacterized protein n=1 Tax=Linum trigynum TaxID=586398 RepID=A0AAV2CW38_9ROSI
MDARSCRKLQLQPKISVEENSKSNLEFLGFEILNVDTGGKDANNDSTKGTTNRATRSTTYFNSQHEEATSDIELYCGSLNKKAPTRGLKNEGLNSQKWQFARVSFYPIWDRFAEAFEERRVKALRSKIFYGGRNDMI